MTCCAAMPAWLCDLLARGLMLGFAFLPLAFIPLLIWMERRGAAAIQDRPGPQRAEILGLRAFGLIHNLSDALKLFFKEDFTPRGTRAVLFVLAPALTVVTAMLAPGFIPWFAPVELPCGAHLGGQPVPLAGGVGLVALLGVSSLSAYAIVLGAWASNSKYPLLGGMRASAMMISYEAALGLFAASTALVAGGLDLGVIADWQAAHGWLVLYQPLAFLGVVICLFAECNRTPFDVVEGESEIVGGFHTEYSSMKFALFFMGEYGHMVVAGAVAAALFLGGFHVPFLDTAALRAHYREVWLGLGILWAGGLAGLAAYCLRLRARYAARPRSDLAARQRELALYAGLAAAAAVAALAVGLAGWRLLPAAAAALPAALAQLLAFLAKITAFCWLFVWVRWTLPRLRYDQVMALGWKVLLPLALANLALTAVVLALLGGR